MAHTFERSLISVIVVKQDQTRSATITRARQNTKEIHFIGVPFKRKSSLIFIKSFL